MLQRVLWVSLTQALRSVALVLLPIAFVALLAWATAGSSNGDTTDPMRAALWIWLGAHHVPFRLTLSAGGVRGMLSYLPIGALLFPLLAIRSGLLRAFDRCDRDPRALRLIRTFFLIFYSAIATLLAWGSNSHAVQPIYYFVILNSAALAVLAGIGIGSPRGKGAFSSATVGLRILAFGLGACAFVLAGSIIFHLQTIQNLTVVLEPGLLGAILLFLLSVLYLPNAILATFSYLVGPGFAVGANTLISPLTHHLAEIPALTLLGALPTGRHPLILFSAVGVVAGGVALYRVTVMHARRALVEALALIIVIVALLGLLSGGALMTSALGAVGVSAWKLTSTVLAELLLGVFIAWSIPRLLEISRNRLSHR